MHLKNAVGESLRLDVIGYQFPDFTGEYYDSNWLLVKIEANLNNQGSWSATDPSLLTADLETLIHWLSKIRAGESVKPLLTFFEPNLQFEIKDGGKKLRVYFELEMRPHWAASQHPDTHDLCFEVGLTPNTLDEMILALEEQCARFPARAAP